ncbi:hypothetical protein RF11_03700 [Thelohanellus kitauei]|uniref:Uncharacterized protein n=1 Tax=Thelohanellus kitauei TaxID=669202 RepID=A0A0C2MF66_THEKT|nr:hypothetical protein RF11_03700 [Thelohanellus kitauei]
MPKDKSSWGEGVFYTHIGKTELVVTLKIDIEYISRDNQTAFNEMQIKKIRFNDSHLYIAFSNPDDQSWSRIKCRTVNTETELEISDCKNFIHSGSDDTIKIFNSKQKFTFKKNIKYAFSKYIFLFKNAELTDKDQMLQIKINYLQILFPNHTQNCEYSKTDFEMMTYGFDSEATLNPCEIGGPTPTNTSIIDIPFDIYLFLTRMTKPWTIIIVSTLFMQVVVIPILFFILIIMKCCGKSKKMKRDRRRLKTK